jgi:hypothetical protein
LDFQDLIKEILNNYEDNVECSKVTLGLFNTFKSCGFKPIDIIEMTRDCESIFPAGRGSQFFKDSPDSLVDACLNIQEKRVLYSLKDYVYKYNGVIINPDGTAYMIDYHGFKVGKDLNNGMPIITYMSTL